MGIKIVEGFKNIYACDSFFSEKENLYRRDKKAAAQYGKWLDRQLGFLDTKGLLVLDQNANAFEKLSGVDEGLYSITRREFNGNPRILFFAVVEEGEQDTFILLNAFKELNGGDYKRNIPTANLRRKTILETI